MLAELGAMLADIRTRCSDPQVLRSILFQSLRLQDSVLPDWLWKRAPLFLAPAMHYAGLVWEAPRIVVRKPVSIYVFKPPLLTICFGTGDGCMVHYCNTLCSQIVQMNCKNDEDGTVLPPAAQEMLQRSYRQPTWRGIDGANAASRRLVASLTVACLATAAWLNRASGGLRKLKTT
jgi:hypothetical protein